MVLDTLSNEILSQVSPTRLWKAIAKNSQSLIPKILPEVIKSIVVLEGDGAVGTVRQCNFTDAIKDFTCWKERVDEIDEEKRTVKYSALEGGLIGEKVKPLTFKYSVIEGGLIGEIVKSLTFKLGFEDNANGGSVCKFTAEFEAVGDGERVKEMIANMTRMFKAVEGYLVANPDAYT